MREDPEQVPVALVADRYRLRELVGAGGMGTVWRATDELLGREVAIKRLRLRDLPPAEAALARERTMREARIAAALHHPHVVSIFDVVVADGEPWLVLEFVPSRSLGDVLRERGSLPPAEVATIGAQVAAALAAAHAAGIVHRDVKPDNVLLATPPASGARGHVAVKLTDFGIAHSATSPTLTATHVLTGTPAYFAPETARGEGTDARSDVYSLGATLYAASEGQPPFGSDPGNVLALLARIGRGDVPPPQRAGPLADLLRRLTDPLPAARPSAEQAHLALQTLTARRGGRQAAGTLGGGPDAGPHAGHGADPHATLPTVQLRGRAPARWSQRRTRLVAAAVALLTAAAAGVLTGVALTGTVDPVGGGAPDAAPVVAAGPVTVGDPMIADPCSVLDANALGRYGSAAVDSANTSLAGCRVDLTQSDGSQVIVTATFENALELGAATGGDREQAGALTVIRYPRDDSGCQRRVVLSDGNAVRVTASTHKTVSSAPQLCDIAETGTIAATARMGRSGIGVRHDAPSPLATVDACSVLGTTDLAVVPGLTGPRRGFAGWACEWGNSTDPSRSVRVSYSRRIPLNEADGVPGEFGGRPGGTQPGPGVCWVEFAQRDVVVGGTPRIESVLVTVGGPIGDTGLCQTAGTLANAAAAKLPPAT